MGLKYSKLCRVQDITGYSIGIGLVLYASIYMYFLFYSPESLGIFNKFIVFIISIDLLLSGLFTYISDDKQKYTINLNIEADSSKEIANEESLQNVEKHNMENNQENNTQEESDIDSDTESDTDLESNLESEIETEIDSENDSQVELELPIIKINDIIVDNEEFDNEEFDNEEVDLKELEEIPNEELQMKEIENEELQIEEILNDEKVGEETQPEELKEVKRKPRKKKSKMIVEETD